MEKFNISEKKVKDLYLRMDALELKYSDIEEKFTRGSGSGGQKINTTANRVQLFHPASGIRVSSQRSRERNQNRFFALRNLVERLEGLLNPKDSPSNKKADKIRKQKKRRKRRSLEDPSKKDEDLKI